MSLPLPPDDDAPDPGLTRTLREALAAPDAPAAWVQRAQSLMAPVGVGDVLVAGARALLRQIQATLRSDSATAPALAHGLRAAASPGATRHLLFSAEGRDIDLRISAAEGGWRVAGQVLGPDEQGEVVLTGPATEPRQHLTALDALGEFRLDGLAPGTYLLNLRLGDAEVVLPALDIGPAA